MRARLIALAVAVATVFALGVGAAIAAPRGGGWMSPDQMHNSEQMRAMHAQMPVDAQAECDAMHAQMGSMMGRMHAQMRGPGR
jgi:hypothetical protein